MRRRVRGILALLMFAAPAPVLAQDEAAAAESSNEEAEELGLLFDVPVPVMAASKSRKADDATLAAAHVIVIPGDEIRSMGWRTLAEVLAGVAEIHLQGERYFPAASIRGMGRVNDFNQRIIVLLDGHVLNDAISDAVGIDLLLPLFQAPVLERVEVILGPASAVYGSTAFYGAVNLVTKKPEGMTGGGLVEGGSHLHRRGTGWWSMKSAPFAPGPGWEVQTFATAMEMEGEDLPTDLPGEALLKHIDWARNGAAYVRGRFGRVSMTVFAQDYRRGTTPTIYDIPDDRDRWYGRTRGSAAIEAVLYDSPQAAVSVKTFANRTQTISHSPYNNWGYMDGIYWYRVFSEEYGGESVAEWRKGRSTLVGSLEYFYQRNKQISKTTHPTDPTDILNNPVAVDAIVRGSVHERLRWERAGLEAGIYAENSRIHGSEVAPSAGLTLLPDRRTTVKLLYGRGFRRPSFYQYNDLDDFDELRPELTDSAEVLVRRRIAPSLTFVGDVYRATYRNFVGTDSAGNYVNERRQQHSQGATGGLEVTGEDGTARADVTVLDVRGSDGSTPLSSPDWIGHASVTLKLPRRVKLGMRGNVIGPRSGHDGEPLPSAVLADAALDIPIRAGFRANVSMTNIADTKFRVPVSRDYTLLDYEPAPGRWMFVQLQWQK